jgi:hypothetical protein
MSRITRNAVYDYIADAIAAVHTNARCTSRYVPVPSSYPSCYIHEIEHYRPLENMQLDYEDVQWQSSFEIQVISNKKGTAASEAYSIMETAKAAFNALYFRELSETSIEGTETFTVIGRFRRQIGGGDSMPT